MKRFWLVLLSLGLIMAFNASAFAVDVKFSGSYFAAGLYLDRAALQKNNVTAQSVGSTASYFQRLQLTTEFVAAPGVSLVTRANILQRVWGTNRNYDDVTGYINNGGSAATRVENENVGIDHAYLNYTSPIGRFLVGYQTDGVWGTAFANSEAARGKITYTLPIGNWAVGAAITKYADNSNCINSSNKGLSKVVLVDSDSDKYSAFLRYTGKSVEGGLVVNYYSDQMALPNYKGKYWNLDPYVKATVGPVAVQAELSYFIGDAHNQNDPENDVKINSLAGWIDAIATFGPVYVDGTIAYAQGPDSSRDKITNKANGGRDWSPTLIMFNCDRSYWIGPLSGNNTFAGNSAGAEVGAFTNAWLYQLKGGVKPTNKLDISAAITFAQADNLNTNPPTIQIQQSSTEQHSSGFTPSKDIGWEIDVTGSYKITNNLSYLLGFGYLFTGDYFKGSTPNNGVYNDYIVLNKLTFTF